MVIGQDMTVSEKPSAASASVEVLEGGTEKPGAETECGPALSPPLVSVDFGILFRDLGTHP